MSQEHDAIRVQKYSSDTSDKDEYSRKVTVSAHGDSIRINLRAALTEVEYRLPAELQFGWDEISDAMADAMVLAREIKKKVGDEAYNKVNSNILMPMKIALRSDSAVESLNDNLRGDIGEMLDHLEDVVKAHIVDYAVSRHKLLSQLMAEKKTVVMKQLHDVLEHGEKAIPNDSD